MEAVEADAEKQEDSGSFPLNFLQRRQSSPGFGTDGVGMATRELQKELDNSDKMAPVKLHEVISAAPVSSADRGRQAVMTLLKTLGVALHSSMLTSLASQIEKDPFAKVKKLIQELIERMLTEAGNEANQKGWCDKSIGDAEQKRDYTIEKLAGLNADMAEFEARRDTLVEELDTLDKEIKELTKAQSDADEERKKEKAENKATVDDANLGLGAVQEAITILDRFYKTAAKSKVETKLIQGPKDDMPDSGFKSGEAYTGAQGGATGVLGMLEVIESDFVRTVKKTEEAEAQAEDDHLKFTTQTQKSLAEKNKATDIKTEQRDETKKKLQEAKDDMKDKTDTLVTVIEELLELQKTCVDTGMSYEERVAAREAEIEALKKALCIFVAFEKFGPDAGDSGC
jgi:septal ring factor EnvC (AmiA/AmiB activator)